MHHCSTEIRLCSLRMSLSTCACSLVMRLSTRQCEPWNAYPQKYRVSVGQLRILMDLSTHCLSGHGLRAPVNVCDKPTLWCGFHLTYTCTMRNALVHWYTGTSVHWHIVNMCTNCILYTPSLPKNLTKPVNVDHCRD